MFWLNLFGLGEMESWWEKSTKNIFQQSCQSSFLTDFNRFSNSQNSYLRLRKPKSNGPFLLTIATLEQ